MVDNVNYAEAHYRFFAEEARSRGCRVHFLHVERPINDCVESTQHGVPEEKIMQMAEKWEHIL